MLSAFCKNIDLLLTKLSTHRKIPLFLQVLYSECYFLNFYIRLPSCDSFSLVLCCCVFYSFTAILLIFWVCCVGFCSVVCHVLFFCFGLLHFVKWEMYYRKNYSSGSGFISQASSGLPLASVKAVNFSAAGRSCHKKVFRSLTSKGISP